MTTLSSVFAQKLRSGLTVAAAFALIISPLGAGFSTMVAHASGENPTTDAATNITDSNATLNGTNGSSDADGHSFWVSLNTIDTSSASVPAGDYTTQDFGAIASNTPFSASLTDAQGMPAVTPSTTYHYVAWSEVGGTWYPGADQTFTTSPAPSTNHAPVAADDTYSVDQDTVLTVPASGVLANDTDADSDPLTAVLVNNVSNGALTLNSDGSFTYTPNSGYTGSDSFTYHANDGTADSNDATVTITVNSTGGSGGGSGSTTPANMVVVVTPSAPQGWVESSANGGSATIVADSSHTGNGALELTTSSDVNAVTHYTHSEDVALSDVSQISYDTKQVSAADATNGNATLRISLNLEGTSDTVDEQLMYEPYYNGFSGGTDWNTWTITPTSGKFWSNYGNTFNGKGGVDAGSYASNFTLADVLHDYPNAKIVGLVASMGSYNVSQQVLVDDVNLTTSTDNTTYNFEQNAAPTCGTGTFDSFNLGSVNGQNGWSATGPYDQAIVANHYGYSTLGCQLLRVSDAVTSGSFGDWVFAAPLANAVGEASSTDGSVNPGTLQSHFEMAFSIAAANTATSTGAELSVAPDRGDGSRMSYLRFEDQADGIHVFFDDVQGTSSPANFVETKIAGGSAATPALDRTVPHTVKLTLDAVDGPSNDVVNVYLDGNLVHTGTSWENYYRYDAEASAEQSPRIVNTMIIQARGAANAADNGYGFVFDNVALTSNDGSTTTPPVVTPPTGSRGGGGGHGSSGGSTGTVTTTGNGGGEVLGASTFNFTRDLTIGSVGDDVTALQNMLIAAGFLHITAATGYFGPLTKAALAAWQAAHGISPAVGYFGPITRAEIAALGLTGTPTGLTDAQRAAILSQLASILQQALAIQAQLTAMST